MENHVAPGVPLNFFDEGAFVDGAGEVHETVAETNRGVDLVGRNGQVDDFFLVTVQNSRGFAAFAKATISTFADFFAAFDR